MRLCGFATGVTLSSMCIKLVWSIQLSHTLKSVFVLDHDLFSKCIYLFAKLVGSVDVSVGSADITGASASDVSVGSVDISVGSVDVSVGSANITGALLLTSL